MILLISTLLIAHKGNSSEAASSGNFDKNMRVSVGFWGRVAAGP